ncbi:NUDIX family protein [Streptomyces noursei ATCC 11455]|nr:NUDIX family protein [Streptomyces noursei ATCC 11455]
MESGPWRRRETAPQHAPEASAAEKLHERVPTWVAVRVAAREVEEETGWRPDTMKPLIYAEPANGITDSQHYVFRADGATYMGPPTEKNESDRIEWVPLSEARAMIDRREVVSSGSLVGLLYVLMDEAIRRPPPGKSPAVGTRTRSPTAPCDEKQAARRAPEDVPSPARAFARAVVREPDRFKALNDPCWLRARFVTAHGDQTVAG